MSKLLLFACLIYLSVSETRQNKTSNSTDLVYDRNVAIEEAHKSKGHSDSTIWSINSMEKLLLIVVLVMFSLLFILFIVYVILAFISPDSLEKLDFRPKLDENLDDAGAQNLCTVFTYWYCCCFLGGLNGIMLTAARRIAELFD